MMHDARANPAPQTEEKQTTAKLEDIFQKLNSRFEPMLAFAMHVHGTAAGQALSWPEIAAKMRGLADAEQALPIPAGMEEQDMKDCRRAVFTLADEILLGSPRQTEQAGLTGWFPHCLQLAYFGDTSGGERFYRQLSALLIKTAVQDTTKTDTDPLMLANPLFATFAKNLPTQSQYGANANGFLPQNTYDTASHVIAPEQIASYLDALQADSGCSESGKSALAAICLHALCLLYGFKGELYGARHLTVVQELTAAAANLLTRLNLPALVAPPEATDAADQATTQKFTLLRHPAVLVLVPLLLCGIWYLACSDMINTIPIP